MEDVLHGHSSQREKRVYFYSYFKIMKVGLISRVLIYWSLRTDNLSTLYLLQNEKMDTTIILPQMTWRKQ